MLPVSEPVSPFQHLPPLILCKSGYKKSMSRPSFLGSWNHFASTACEPRTYIGDQAPRSYCPSFPDSLTYTSNPAICTYTHQLEGVIKTQNLHRKVSSWSFQKVKDGWTACLDRSALGDPHLFLLSHHRGFTNFQFFSSDTKLDTPSPMPGLSLFLINSKRTQKFRERVLKFYRRGA